MQSDSTFVNIAAYKFISFDDTAEMRPQFRVLCAELGLRGTILLSPEGINLFLAGLREPIDRFLAWLRADPRFADLVVKESYSDKQPFNRMLVKLKAEIITMKHPLIKPENGRAPTCFSRRLVREQVGIGGVRVIARFRQRSRPSAVDSAHAAADARHLWALFIRDQRAHDPTRRMAGTRIQDFWILESTVCQRIRFYIQLPDRLFSSNRGTRFSAAERNRDLAVSLVRSAVRSA
jgi:hypothetical protein